MKKILFIVLTIVLIVSCQVDPQNRREIQDLMNDSITSVVTINRLKTVIDSILTHGEFRGDSIRTAVVTGSDTTIVYGNADYWALTISSDVEITISDLGQGDVKWLKVSKNAGDKIRFANAINHVNDTNYVDDELTSVYYEVYNKDGSNYQAKSMVIDNYPVTGLTRDTIIEIGDWDMTAGNTNVTHGLGSDWKNIRGINIIIRNDADNNYYPLDRYYTLDSLTQGGITAISSTVIGLARKEGGFFDGTDFNQTSYNRGFVYIEIAQ